MMFYESGGRAYGVFQVEKELIPEVGYHIPGKMGGIWFEDTRVISSIKVEGFGSALDVVYEDAGRTLKFEKGEIDILIPRFEKSVYFRFKGSGKVSFEIDGTRVWLSKPERFEIIGKGDYFEIGDEDLKIDYDGNLNIFDRGFEIRIDGENTLCVSFENSKSDEFDIKRSVKERDLKTRVPEGRSNLEGKLKTFIYEMYLKTKNGNGFMAGLEEYPWWFAIDTSFLVPELLKMGFSDLVRESLHYIISKSEDIPPHEIVTNGVVNDVYNEIELFSILHSVFVYTHETGDESLLEESQGILRRAIDDLSKGFPKGKGMVEVEGGDEWLDVSSYAFALLKEYEILKKRGIFESEDLDRSLEFFEDNFLKYWYDEESKLFKDEGIHFTQVLPLHFGLIPKEIGKKILESLEKIGMITQKGLRHSLRKSKDEGYYGEKSEKVWWISNYLLKSAGYKYDTLDLSFLEDLFEEDLGRYKTPPEIVGGGGCFAQTWSALFGLFSPSKNNVV